MGARSARDRTMQVRRARSAQGLGRRLPDVDGTVRSRGHRMVTNHLGSGRRSTTAHHRVGRKTVCTAPSRTRRQPASTDQLRLMILRSWVRPTGPTDVDSGVAVRSVRDIGHRTDSVQLHPKHAAVTHHQSGDCGGCIGLLSGEHVAVDLQGERNVGVAESLGNEPRVLAAGEEVGGVGVPQAVDRQVWQAAFLYQSGEGPRYDVGVPAVAVGHRQRKAGVLPALPSDSRSLACWRRHERSTRIVLSSMST